jgi:hypothetical protein
MRTLFGRRDVLTFGARRPEASCNPDGPACPAFPRGGGSVVFRDRRRRDQEPVRGSVRPRWVRSAGEALDGPPPCREKARIDDGSAKRVDAA